MQQHKRFHPTEKTVNFLAGLIAGFVSVTICNPLDITRTRLNIMCSPDHQSGKYTHFSHAMKTIWKEEGFKGFYTGYKTNVIAIPLFHSLFFPIYEYIKKTFIEKGHSDSKSCLIATTSAGTVCNIITNPIWVVRTRVMVQYLHPQHLQYQSSLPWKIVKQMVQEEGFLSLFRGLSASLLSVSNAIVYFLFYQKIKTLLKKSSNQFSVFNIFIASTVSKLIASSITYPMIVVRTVLHDARAVKQPSLLSILRHIWQENGIYGFYHGLKPDLIRLIPSNAILFICYEEAKRYL